MPNNKNICDCYYCEGKYCYRIDARDCEGYIDILVTECEEHPDCEHKQLNQLKTENETLKEKIIISSNSDKRTLKIIQALSEINENVKNVKKNICNNCGWRNTDSCDPEDYICGEFIKILKKIEEVLDVEHN